MQNCKREILQGFFVLEGLDGSGKTTQLQHLTNRAHEQSVRFRADREPTNDAIGQKIRSSVHEQAPSYTETNQASGKSTNIFQKDLAQLFAQDRQNHIEGQGGVREFLAGGGILFSDRYLFSSLAYQSQELPFEEVLALNAHFSLPEAVFFFEIDLKTAQSRLKNRSEKMSLFDDIDFQNKVLKGYERAFKAFPEVEVIRLNACNPASHLTDQIWRRIFR